MATVSFELRDTPNGVAVHTTFKPAVGQPLTPAQMHALEVMRRTSALWGLPVQQTNAEVQA